MRWWLPLLLLLGCNNDPLNEGAAKAGVGRSCDGSGASPGVVLIKSPAPECPKGVCLVEPDRALCTANCDNDAQCAGADSSSCAEGFVCRAVTAVGPFHCQKMCVCAPDDPMLTACP